VSIPATGSSGLGEAGDVAVRERGVRILATGSSGSWEARDGAAIEGEASILATGSSGLGEAGDVAVRERGVRILVTGSSGSWEARDGAAIEGEASILATGSSGLREAGDVAVREGRILATGSSGSTEVGDGAARGEVQILAVIISLGEGTVIEAVGELAEPVEMLVTKATGFGKGSSGSATLDKQALDSEAILRFFFGGCLVTQLKTFVLSSSGSTFALFVLRHEW
jgi:hypothetical protein